MPGSDNVGKVILFRPFRLIGSALRFEIYFKDSLQTTMKSRSYFIMELPEGKHRISAVTGTLDMLKRSKNTIDLNIEAGKIYFIKCSAKSFSESIVKPNFKLMFEVLNKEETKRALQHNKFIRKRIKDQLFNIFL